MIRHHFSRAEGTSSQHPILLPVRRSCITRFLNYRRLISVLLVSGGMAGVIDEILKYDVSRLDYVELDPAIISAGMQHLDIRFSPEVHLHRGDGRKFIQRTDKKYEGIILESSRSRGLSSSTDFIPLNSSRRPGRHFCREALYASVFPGRRIISAGDQARFLSTLQKHIKAGTLKMS